LADLIDRTGFYMLLPDDGSRVSFQNVVYIVYISDSGQCPTYSLFNGSKIVIIELVEPRRRKDEWLPCSY